MAMISHLRAQPFAMYTFTSCVLFFCIALAKADEAPQARSYMDWLDGTLAGIEKDMPTVTHGAEAAAAAVRAGRDQAVRGDNGLANEISHRAGGFIFVSPKRGQGGDVVLYALGLATSGQPNAQTRLQRQISEIQQLRHEGSVVIGIASIRQLRSVDLLARDRQACTVLLDNRAPPQDGITHDGTDRAIVPTFTTVNAAVAWTWCAELFAACTRDGKTLAVLPDLHGPIKDETFERRWSMRFHDPTIDPAEPGVPWAIVPPETAGRPA